MTWGGEVTRWVGGTLKEGRPKRMIEPKRFRGQMDGPLLPAPKLKVKPNCLYLLLMLATPCQVPGEKLENAVDCACSPDLEGVVPGMLPG